MIPETKTLNIIFFNGNSLISKIIKFFTRSKVTSHVGILVANNLYMETWGRNIFDIHWKTTTPSDHIIGTPYKILSKDIITSLHDKIICEFTQKVLNDVKYDWLALLGFVIPLKINMKDRDFCSEGIQDVLAKYDITPQSLPGWKVSPDNLYYLLLAEGFKESEWLIIK